MAHKMTIAAIACALLLISCKKEEQNAWKTIEWVVQNQDDTTIVVISNAEMNATGRNRLMTYIDSIPAGGQVVLRSYVGAPYSSVNGLFSEINIYKNNVINTVSVFADHRWSRTQTDEKEVNLIQVDAGFFE